MEDHRVASRTAWVVLGSSGQYSDWSQWAVCVCPDEQAAKDRVGELSSATRIHWAAKPGPDEGESFDEWWDRPGREEALAEWEATLSNIDPDTCEYDQASYRACEVPLIAAPQAAIGDAEPSAALLLAKRALEYVGWFDGTYGPQEILDADAELQSMAMAVYRELGEPEPQIVKRLRGKRP